MFQPDSGFVSVDALIYEGDIVEIRDPRGGIENFRPRVIGRCESDAGAEEHCGAKLVRGYERRKPSYTLNDNFSRQ